jgi:hypothetical protein
MEQSENHDVFISYAHIDNQSLVEGEKGWVDQFHYALEVRLKQLMHKQARIWRDPEIEGNRIFDEALTNRIRETPVLLSIFSPNYFDSDWCQRELNQFLDVAPLDGSGRIGELARVFKVIKTPVPRTTHHESLQKLLGYEFHGVDSSTNREREFSRDTREASSLKYWNKLEDLAQDICQVLKMMKEGGKDDKPSHSEQDTRNVVFLAETTVDRRDDRDNVQRELEGQGYAVLPKQPLPTEGQHLRKEVEGIMAQACVSVHLIGERFGMVPEGESKSVIEIQHELALEGSQQDRHCLIWLPPKLQTKEERQAEFVQTLRQEETIRTNMELLEAPLEEFKTHLLDRLKQQQAKQEKPARRQQADTSGDPSALTIYLVCDPRDREAVEPIEAHLLDKGFEVNLSATEEDGVNVREWHQDNLCLCDASLIFYGVTTAMWLKSQLMELKKAFGFGRARPYAAKAIYVSSPITPEKERFRTNDALVLRDGKGFDPAILAPFIQKLREHSGPPPL